MRALINPLAFIPSFVTKIIDVHVQGGSKKMSTLSFAYKMTSTKRKRIEPLVDMFGVSVLQ
ncbi:MAG: hypothetical protein GY820_34295 [Gammaproteobacteria bacterium]|nr:hypothetical protein [Gammaproteobacteria bacterium]